MLLLAIICIILVVWIRYRYKKLNFFERLGIPGPKPHFFYGNLKEIWEKGIGPCQLEWTRKYGKISGYYLGLKPIVLITDKDLVNRIEVKDMSVFSSRELLLPTAGIADDRIVHGLSFQVGEDWKKTRNSLTPAFSTAKIKQIFHYINVGTETFLKNLAKIDSQEDINIADRLGRLTADNILTTALGVKTDVQANPKDKVYGSIALLLSSTYADKLIYLPFCLPEFIQLFHYILVLRDLFLCNVLGQPSVKFAFDKCVEAIVLREKGMKVQVKDLLQLMLDTREEAKENKEDSVLLNRDYLVGNAIIMVLAGHDTVGTLLSCMCHLLTHHQDVQDKLRSQITEVVKNEKLTYEHLGQLEYIDRVISETLRLYPPSSTVVSRKAMQPYEYNGTKFPAGSSFQVAVSALHRNAEVWMEPDRFDPDRFLPERKSEFSNADYQPFGFGPRNCIGMRFALLEAKMVLARLLQTYKLVKSSKTEGENLLLKDKLFTIEPKNGVHVKLIRL